MTADAAVTSQRGSAALWGSGLLWLSRGVIMTFLLVIPVILIVTELQDSKIGTVVILYALWMIAAFVGAATLVVAVIGLALTRRGQREVTRLDTCTLAIAGVLTLIGVGGIGYLLSTP